MWWAGSRVWDIYLGGQCGAVAHGTAPVVWRQHSSPEAGLSDLLASPGLPARTWPRPRLRLWLSGALARPFVFEAPEGLRNAAEMLALAQARAEQASGLMQPCEVRLSEPSVGRLRLAVALNRGVYQALLAAASKAKVQLVSVAPWWACAQQAALREQPELQALTVIDTDAVTLLAAEQDHWTAAQCFVPALPGGQLHALVARFVLSSSASKSHSVVLRLDAASADSASSAWPWALAREVAEPA